MIQCTAIHRVECIDEGLELHMHVHDIACNMEMMLHLAPRCVVCLFDSAWPLHGIAANYEQL